MKKFTKVVKSIGFAKNTKINGNILPKFGQVRRFGGVKPANRAIIAKNSFKIFQKPPVERSKLFYGKQSQNSLFSRKFVNFGVVFRRKFCAENTPEMSEKQQIHKSDEKNVGVSEKKLEKILEIYLSKKEALQLMGDFTKKIMVEQSTVSFKDIVILCIITPICLIWVMFETIGLLTLLEWILNHPKN